VDEYATTFAAPGPFADSWLVDLHYSNMTQLDFTGVNKAYFDFCGTHYTFG
jgi:hypothetical protein